MADDKKLGRVKLLSLSSGSSDDGESNSDGQQSNSAITKKKKVATKKRGRGAGKTKLAGAGKKPAGKKRTGSSSSSSSASSSSAVSSSSSSSSSSSYSSGNTAKGKASKHATAPTLPGVDGMAQDTEMDPWVALNSTGDTHDDMFYPGQQDDDGSGGGNASTPAHLRMAGAGGGSRDGAEVDAWDSELLSFNSGHFDGFSPDADYSRMLATGAGATPDNAGWLPTTYLPGIQHSASPMPGGVSASSSARHQPQLNQMLVLA